METFSVVEYFDIFEYVLFSLSSGLVTLMMNQFSFQGIPPRKSKLGLGCAITD